MLCPMPLLCQWSWGVSVCFLLQPPLHVSRNRKTYDREKTKLSHHSANQMTKFLLQIALKNLRCVRVGRWQMYEAHSAHFSLCDSTTYNLRPSIPHLSICWFNFFCSRLHTNSGWTSEGMKSKAGCKQHTQEGVADKGRTNGTSHTW